MAKIFGNTTATPLMAEQKYNPASDKPQSGKAIAGVISGLLDRVKNVTFDEYYDVDGYSASYSEGVYKAKNGFVIQRVSSYSESGSYYGVDQYWYNGGDVYFRSLGDEGGWQNDWRKISVSQTDLDKKVDKIKGKGLSTEDFTTALKNKLETMPEGGSDITVDSELSTTSTNPVQNKVIAAELNKKADKELAFTGYIEATFDASTGGYDFDLDSIDDEGVYLLRLPSNDDDNCAIYYILSVCVSYDKTMLIQTLYRLDNGEITQRLNKKGGWEKISVSQTDLNTAIGDIETSLENIIKKYGLGGDSQ